MLARRALQPQQQRREAAPLPPARTRAHNLQKPFCSIGSLNPHHPWEESRLRLWTRKPRAHIQRQDAAERASRPLLLSLPPPTARLHGGRSQAPASRPDRPGSASHEHPGRPKLVTHTSVAHVCDGNSAFLSLTGQMAPEVPGRTPSVAHTADEQCLSRHGAEDAWAAGKRRGPHSLWVPTSPTGRRSLRKHENPEALTHRWRSAGSASHHPSPLMALGVKFDSFKYNPIGAFSTTRKISKNISLGHFC